MSVRQNVDRISNSAMPFRYVAAPDHRDWTVRAVAGTTPPTDAIQLVFISDDEVRWVDAFPNDWIRLDDTALYELSLEPSRR